jgi:hypothetical protein
LTFALVVGFFGCDSESDEASPRTTAAESSASTVDDRKQVAKTFSPEDIAAIKTLLQDLDSTDYRVVLPVMNDSEQMVGTQTYGTFPVTEVRRIASLRNIRYTDSGNLQAIFLNCNGGGAGSHTESGSGATGRAAISQIEEITQNVDSRAYILIK